MTADPVCAWCSLPNLTASPTCSFNCYTFYFGLRPVTEDERQRVEGIRRSRRAFQELTDLSQELKLDE